MPTAQSGDTVKVHYTGKLKNGTVFDSSVDKEPLEFTLGEGSVIPGFEAAVTGMKVGEKKTEFIQAEEAYGPHHDVMVKEFEKAMIPSEIELEVGQHIQISREGVESIVMTVVEITDSHITMDGNHPLAGQDLIFEIELVEVVNSAA